MIEGWSAAEVITYLLGGLVAFLIWQAKRLIGRVDALEKELAAVADDKADATELHRDYGALRASVEKCHERIDKLLERA